MTAFRIEVAPPAGATAADLTSLADAREELYGEVLAAVRDARVHADGGGDLRGGGLEALLVAGLTGGAVKALLDCLKVWLEMRRSRTPRAALKLTLPDGAGEITLTSDVLGPDETARIAARLRAALAST